MSKYINGSARCMTKMEVTGVKTEKMRSGDVSRSPVENDPRRRSPNPGDILRVCATLPF